MSHPSKVKGYTAEVMALKALRVIFPHLKRTGSVNYSKAAADLSDGQLAVQVKRRARTWLGGVFRETEKANPDSLCFVVTKDTGVGNPLLVTMRISDLISLVKTYDWSNHEVEKKRTEPVGASGRRTHPDTSAGGCGD